MTTSALINDIRQNGFALLPHVFSGGECDQLNQSLLTAFQTSDDDSETLRARTGSIYGSRNLLKLCPAVRDVWRRPALVETLTTLLGRDCGLVRALFFDKPPDRTWSLPWHKDLTIAVRDNSRPSRHFLKPTLKAGVPHVEAPLELLQQMLTFRIHLDDVNDENGPLHVIPGSHLQRVDEPEQLAAPEPIHCSRGDVLAMRPLLTHSSTASAPHTTRHRRILHLEFAATCELPDGFEWHDWLAIAAP